MDDLADLLTDEIRDEFRRCDLFRTIPVIVPNRSIRRYLSIRFALRHIVAARIEFPSLMSIFRRMNRREGEPGPNIDEKTIGWRIYRILRESGDDFPVLTRWIDGDSKRLYDLSRQLGALYDKYLLYRPDWINDWESERMPRGLTGEPAAVWQSALWRRVAADDWKGNHFAGAYDRIMRGEIPDYIRSGTIRIFGFSQLPPAVVRCLERFGDAGAVVKLYHLTPSEVFYGEDKSDRDELKAFLDRLFHEGRNPEQLREDMEQLYFQHNPLVASFATQSRILLSETGNWDDDRAIPPAGEEMPEVREDDTILHRLQDRIRKNAGPGKAEAAPPEDGSPCRSVQIRSCYSAFREVEAAHNFILHCLDEDPELSLKDIFIMTPSPEEYAPLVDAVFHHSDGAMRLPVSVADRPQTDRLPSFRTFLNVLALYKGDFTASDIFGILQDRDLQTQWGLTTDDCQFCLNRAVQAGIRWGWDAEEHRLSGGKAFPENSWQAGFDRMLLSFAMDADPAAPYRINGEDVIFPVPGFEDGRSALLGKFICLTGKLHEIAQTMRRLEQTGMPFREWENLLADAAGYLFGRESELKMLLLSLLNVWLQLLKDAGAEDVILTSGIVLAFFQDNHVRPEDNTMGFMRGRITFCGLRPMRSIPADAILLLGMNHEVFPEDDDGREFDMMLQYRQAGDRGSAVGREPGDPLRRDESRQLFLDTIMAARRYLYISYIGRDNHDRKEKPPSVCVDELKTYLTRTFGKNSFVELQEPIHSFSTDLFRRGAANQSYSETLRHAAEQIANPVHPNEKPLFDVREGVCSAGDLPADRVSLQDLIGFFADPAGTFVRKSLDARVSVRDALSPEDSEPFEGKSDWGQLDGLIRLYLETEDSDREVLKHNCLQWMKDNGTVPLTRNEEDWADWTLIAGIANAVESAAGAGTEIRIPAEETILEYLAADTGDLAEAVFDPVPDCTFRTVLVLPEAKVFQPEEADRPCIQTVWSFANEINGAQLVGPILAHLRANLDRRTMTRIVYPGGKDRAPAVMTADAMEKTEAESAFREYLCLYLAGMRRPLPFFPKTSYEYFRTGNENSARNVWDGSFFQGDSAKFEQYFGSELQIDDRFIQTAGAFFGKVSFVGSRGKKA